jgi:hypothetical protein
MADSGRPHRFIVQKVSGGRDNSGVGLFVGTLQGYCLSPTPWWLVEEGLAHRFSDSVAAQSAVDELARLGHKTEVVLIPVAGELEWNPGRKIE